MTTDYHKLMMEIIHGETEKSRQREYQWFKKKYPVMGHRADATIIDDGQTPMLPFDKRYSVNAGQRYGKTRMMKGLYDHLVYGTPMIAEAISHQKAYNKVLAAQAPWLTHDQIRNLIGDQEEDMTAPIYPKQRQHCHLCFAKRKKLDSTSNSTEKQHDSVDIVTFECGTTITRVMCESKANPDDEWTIDEDVLTVAKGKNCI